MLRGNRNVDAVLSEVLNVQSKLSEETNNDSEAEGENKSEAEIGKRKKDTYYRGLTAMGNSSEPEGGRHVGSVGRTDQYVETTLKN